MPSGSETKAKKILVVDDDQDMLDFVSEILFDCIVETTKDPVEAATMLLGADNDVDLVFCDYKLPSMNGIDLYRQLKNLGGVAQKKFSFVIMTGYGFKHLEDEALAMGIDAFLNKPVHKERFKEIVALHCGRSRP